MRERGFEPPKALSHQVLSSVITFLVGDSGPVDRCGTPAWKLERRGWYLKRLDGLLFYAVEDDAFLEAAAFLVFLFSCRLDFFV